MSIKDKLTSRKFLTAIAGIIAGIAMIFGLDEEVVSTIAGAVLSLASILTYVLTEGAIDKAALSFDIESIIEVEDEDSD